MRDRYWCGEVGRISPGAPVPVVLVARREDRLGGAANVARNIVALGAQASLLGIVGGDEPGAKVGTLAREAGINSCLVTDEQSPTPLNMRALGTQQPFMRVDYQENGKRE